MRSIEDIERDLLETDALTGDSEGTPDWYVVHPENVAYLIETVLYLANE